MVLLWAARPASTHLCAAATHVEGRALLGRRPPAGRDVQLDVQRQAPAGRPVRRAGLVSECRTQYNTCVAHDESARVARGRMPIATFMETKIIKALMRAMKQDGGATRLINMKAGVPCNSEKGSETLATMVGAVMMRAFFEAYPDARVVLAGGAVHRYDQATRQLVMVSDAEQTRFEKQGGAQYVAQKWHDVPLE